MQSRSLAAAAIQSATFPELESVFLVGRKKNHLIRKECGRSLLRNSNQHLRLLHFPDDFLSLWAASSKVFFNFLLFIKKHYISDDGYILLYESQTI